VPSEPQASRTVPNWQTSCASQQPEQEDAQLGVRLEAVPQAARSSALRSIAGRNMNEGSLPVRPEDTRLEIVGDAEGA
jgi:hypothetical protein